MHTSGKPFVSTPADEEQAVSLQNGAVPHTLRLDKVLMEVNSDRAHLGGDQPGTVGRRLACGFHKRWRSEHRPARVPAVFRKKTPGQPVIPRRRMPLAPRRKIRAATAVREHRGRSRLPAGRLLHLTLPPARHTGAHELVGRPWPSPPLLWSQRFRPIAPPSIRKPADRRLSSRAALVLIAVSRQLGLPRQIPKQGAVRNARCQQHNRECKRIRSAVV